MASEPVSSKIQTAAALYLTLSFLKSTRIAGGERAANAAEILKIKRSLLLSLTQISVGEFNDRALRLSARALPRCGSSYDDSSTIQFGSPSTSCAVGEYPLDDATDEGSTVGARSGRARLFFYLTACGHGLGLPPQPCPFMQALAGSSDCFGAPASTKIEQIVVRNPVVSVFIPRRFQAR